MARMYRKYDKAFKLEPNWLYEMREKSVSQIEKELGITSGLLNKWRVRQRVVTTQVAADRPVAANLLQEDFSAILPNQI